MNERKYLIIECEELGDQYECDADRKPIAMVSDISLWKELYGYEIYMLKADGKFELIKNYEDGEFHIEWSSRGTCYLANRNNAFICKWPADGKP